jgi:thiol-disulfide isomerase/thioredoxin
MKPVPIIVLALLIAPPLQAQDPAEEEARPITKISGTLLGADGTPMELAHVSLYPASGRSAIQTVEVAPDGTYAIETDTAGVFTIWYTGVDHFVRQRYLLLSGDGGEIQIDAQLGTHTYLEDRSELSVIGDFNSFSFASGAKQMEPQDDGTFLATFEVEADTLAYQVINAVQGRSINGTQSDRYVYDGDGDYRSIVPVHDGVARITFDPNKVFAVDTTAEVRFADPNRFEARYAEFRQRLTERRTALFQEQMKLRDEDASREEIRALYEEFDGAPDADLLEDMLAETGEKNLRQILLATYLTDALKTDSVYAQMALDEIEPGSPSWSLGPSLPVRAVQASGIPDAYSGFLHEVLRETKDEDTRLGILFHLLGAAARDSSDAELRLLLSWIVAEYPESFQARYAMAEYDPAGAIRVGNPVPAFEIASLSDSTVLYSNETMLGRVYLMDFWAVWCGPCVGEMPHLHEAYEKYRDDGLTILSLSFDEKPEDVFEFCEDGEWSMPWLHAFVPEGFESNLSETFQVFGIPKPILVDADGTIIARRGELRGEELDKTLARVFGREVTDLTEPEP